MRKKQTGVIRRLKMYVVSAPIYNITSLALRVGVGSVMEQKGEEGLAHFL